MKQRGFSGFLTVDFLMATDCADVIERKGIYFVIHPFDQPSFLSTSVGGHFKGKDPTVSLSILENNWIDNTRVVYIGQTGGSGSKATLKKRLRQYMRFGEGDPVGHWGGRFIWQIENHRDLLVAWKTTGLNDARTVEKSLISEFKDIYGSRPYANLTG